MNDWISLKNRLPKKDTLVGVRDFYGNVLIAQVREYNPGKKYWEDTDEIKYPIDFFKEWRDK